MPVPVVHGITGNQQRALARRPPRVEAGGQAEIGNSSEPFTARTQAIDHLEFASLLDLPPALGDGDRPCPGNGGDIERERLRATDVGFPETAEKNAELGVRIGGGSERGTGVCAQPFLVDDDRGGQAAEKGAPRVRRAIGIARFTHPGSRAPGGWDPPEKEF